MHGRTGTALCAGGMVVSGTGQTLALNEGAQDLEEFLHAGDYLAVTETFLPDCRGRPMASCCCTSVTGYGGCAKSMLKRTRSTGGAINGMPALPQSNQSKCKAL